jgi:hypothetical protein
MPGLLLCGRGVVLHRDFEELIAEHLPHRRGRHERGYRRSWRRCVDTNPALAERHGLELYIDVGRLLREHVVRACLFVRIFGDGVESLDTPVARRHKVGGGHELDSSTRCSQPDPPIEEMKAMADPAGISPRRQLNEVARAQ